MPTTSNRAGGGTKMREHRSVASTPTPRADSGEFAAPETMEHTSPQTVERQLTRPQKGGDHTDGPGIQTKRLPLRTEIAAAARSLARLPQRSERRWTGYITPRQRGYKHKVIPGGWGA